MKIPVEGGQCERLGSMTEKESVNKGTMLPEIISKALRVVCYFLPHKLQDVISSVSIWNQAS